MCCEESDNDADLRNGNEKRGYFLCSNVFVHSHFPLRGSRPLGGSDKMSAPRICTAEIHEISRIAYFVGDYYLHLQETKKCL